MIRDDSLPLLEVAHFVKFDVQAFTRDQLAEQVEALHAYKVSLIASKIEDHHTLEACKELDFDHFQGYFFCQPKTVTGKGIPSNRLTQMRLMTVLQDPHCELEELERSITNDLGVSFRLLRFSGPMFLHASPVTGCASPFASMRTRPASTPLPAR